MKKYGFGLILIGLVMVVIVITLVGRGALAQTLDEFSYLPVLYKSEHAPPPTPPPPTPGPTI